MFFKINSLTKSVVTIALIYIHVFQYKIKSLLAIDLSTAAPSSSSSSALVINKNSSDLIPQNIYNCWNINECIIHAKFTRNNFTFHVNIDCNENNDQSSAAIVLDPFKRFSNVGNISLNGCDVNRTDTLGIEHIPDPNSVYVLYVEKFQANSNTTINREHFKTLTNLHILTLRKNVIERLNAFDTFDDLIELETLTIDRNNLQYIHSSLFEPLRNLKNLTIIEPQLNLKFLTFFSNLTNVRIECKTLWWSPQWPDTLTSLNIRKTTIIFDDETKNWFDFIELIELSELHLTTDNLTVFPQIVSGSLKVLNFSDNSLSSLETNDLDNLTICDISANKFIEINANFFQLMPNLREIFAQNNQIEFIADDAFISNNVLQLIDITGNRLKTIEFNVSHICPPVRIVIDDNPLSCLWISEIVSSRPEFFEKFQFIQKLHTINVKGLQCIEQMMVPKFPPIFDENLYRRNPRDTAILTLIILAIGVAVLFFLLYLHIKCRQNNQTPFYRSISNPSSTFKMSERTDIIRKRILPATDYEVPIDTSGRLSTLCRDNTGNDKLPGIYEEIPEKISSSLELLTVISVDTENKDNPILSAKTLS